MANDITISDGANLSKTELALHEEKALRGNEESISKLIDYYQYWDFQPEKIAYWYEISASFGDVESKYKSGIMYSLGDNGYTVTKSSCEKGLALLNECQQVNYKDSKVLYLNAEKSCSKIKVQ